MAEVKTITDAVRDVAYPLTGKVEKYDPLMELIADARFVLIGEATHGTHEFYEQRAEITKRLIQEKGFTAVAVAADWPDAYRVNRYVQGVNDDPTPEALQGFQGFPSWMWCNTDVLNFVGWLRQYEEYYRSMFRGRVSSWNLRDRQMTETLDRRVAHLDRRCNLSPGNRTGKSLLLCSSARTVRRSDSLR